MNWLGSSTEHLLEYIFFPKAESDIHLILCGHFFHLTEAHFLNSFNVTPSVD